MLYHHSHQKKRDIRKDVSFLLVRYFCFAKVVACGRVTERERGNPSKVPPSHAPLLAVCRRADNKTCGQAHQKILESLVLSRIFSFPRKG